MKTYVDTLVALVPADVLAAAGVFVAVYTNSTKNAEGKETIIVTDHSGLKAAFFGLVVLGPVLYLLGHCSGLKDLKKLDRHDALRMLIPAGAFIGWAIAQRPSSLFDAAISISDGHKTLLLVFGAVILGTLAQRLGVAADNKPPPAL